MVASDHGIMVGGNVRSLHYRSVRGMRLDVENLDNAVVYRAGFNGAAKLGAIAVTSAVIP